MKQQIRKNGLKALNLLLKVEGQDIVEYALVVALMAFGVTAATKSLATQLSTTFTNMGSYISSSVA
jgi:pilus assembly protein Flp/PilA